MFNFTKRKRLSEEDLEDIVNNSENSKFSDNNSDISSEIISRHISLKIRNVLKRRRECGTYLATARRHRRRLKMQKRDEKRRFQPALRPSSAVEED